MNKAKDLKARLPDVIETDDHAYCLHHGGSGHAVKADLIGETDNMTYEQALEKPQRLNFFLIKQIPL